MSKQQWITLVAAALVACGGSPAPYAADAGQTPDAGAPVSDAGSGLAPHVGIASVAGGAAMSSARYRLITTTGQGPADNATLSSGHYVLVGGVVGGTQAR